MFNVLPQEYIEILKKEYNQKKIIIWLGVVVFIQVIILVLFVSVFIIIGVEEKNLYAENVNFKTSTKIDDIKNTIDITNKKSHALLGMMNKFSTVNDVRAVVRLRGGGIIFDKIYVAKKTDDTREFLFTGTATTRDNLSAFVKRIQNTKEITGVDIPVSSYSKQKDLDFSIKFVYSNNI